MGSSLFRAVRHPIAKGTAGLLVVLNVFLPTLALAQRATDTATIYLYTNPTPGSLVLTLAFYVCGVFLIAFNKQVAGYLAENFSSLFEAFFVPSTIAPFRKILYGFYRVFLWVSGVLLLVAATIYSVAMFSSITGQP